MHRRVGRPPNSATEFGWCRSADSGGVAVNLRQLCTAMAVIVSAEFLMAEPLPVVPTRTAPESAPANGKPYADKYLSEDTTPIDSSDGTHIARGDESLNGLRQYTATQPKSGVYRTIKYNYIETTDTYRINGLPCTVDCAEEMVGYRKARAKGIADIKDCPKESELKLEALGCSLWVLEQKK